MAGNRSRKETLRYIKHRRAHASDPECEFCHLGPGDEQYLGEGQYFKIIRNIFPYTIWDELSVLDHLMIVPKFHTETLLGISDEAAVEYVRLLGEYEAKGYSSYVRAPGVSTKSVAHHHTHLLQTSGKRLRFHMYVNKPYFRVSH